MATFTTDTKFKFIVGGLPVESITAIALSEAIDIGDRVKLSVHIHGANADAVRFLVSNDGTNFIPYNRVNSNVTNTNAQNDTRVTTLTLSGTDAIAFFPEGDHFKYIKLDATTVTGPLSASLHAVI